MIKILVQKHFRLIQNQQRFYISQYFPVLNIHTFNCVEYHQKYNLRFKELLKVEKNSEEVDPNTLKKFLIQQYQKNEELLETRKEVLILGRSNVGKSSLINTVLGSEVSLTSKKRGTTKKLYMNYIPKLKGYIVDSPGYGYSDVSVQAVKKWQAMLKDYCFYSSRLCRIIMLINSEHGLKDSDLYLLKLLDAYNINIQMVMTKCDKIPEDKLFDRMIYIAHQINKDYKNVHPLLHSFSSKTLFGVNQLKSSFIDSFQSFKPRQTDGYESVMIKHLRLHQPQTRLTIKEIIKRQKIQEPRIPKINQKLQIQDTSVQNLY